MFQFKNPSLNGEKSSATNAMPNSFGKVRTFKEDFENFEKGSSPEPALEAHSALPHEMEKPTEKTPPPKEPEVPQKAPPVLEKVPANPFQSLPTPPPLQSADSGLPAFKSSPSQSFFQEKSTPQENIFPKPAEDQKESLPKPKNKRLLRTLFVLLLIVIAAGAGYYYWFNVRSASPAAPSSSTLAPTQSAQRAEQVAPPTPSDTQNKNIRQLVVDTTQGTTEVKNAIQKFSADFAASASENDLVEVKIIGKNSQPIGKKDFLAGTGAAIPDPVLMKLSEDYSLFAKKEGGSVKLGAAFKTVTSSSLTEEMKKIEPTLAKNLEFLYLGQTPSAVGPFDSNQYKNADIRYFNFSSPSNTSIDYSVISSFLVIGTSKYSMYSILDYMSEK